MLQRLSTIGQARAISHHFWGQFWRMHTGADTGQLLFSQQFTLLYAYTLPTVVWFSKHVQSYFSISFIFYCYKEWTYIWPRCQV